MALAADLDILVHFANIKTVADAHQFAPKAKVVVGSDGSHSLIRSEVFDSRGLGFEVHNSLMYIVDVKYEVRLGPSFMSDEITHSISLRECHTRIFSQKLTPGCW